MIYPLLLLIDELQVASSTFACSPSEIGSKAGPGMSHVAHTAFAGMNAEHDVRGASRWKGRLLSRGREESEEGVTRTGKRAIVFPYPTDARLMGKRESARE